MITKRIRPDGRRRGTVLVCLVSVALVASACGDDDGGASGDAASGGADFPTEDIRAVIPFGAGGNTDTEARVVLDAIDQLVDVSVVAENVTGGGGTLGLIEAMNRPPDGHTLGLVFPSIHAYGQVVHDTAYDMTEMQYIGGFRDHANVIGVAASSGIETFEELLQHGQEQGRLVAVSGPPSNYLVMAKQIADEAGAEFDSLAYEGVPQAFAGLEAGDGDFWVGGAASAAALGDSMNVLAVAASEPSEHLPGVPTLDELGYDFYEDPISAGFVVHPDTDPAVVDELRGLMEEALAGPEVQEYVDTHETSMTHIPADEFRESALSAIEAAREYEDVLTAG